MLQLVPTKGTLLVILVNSEGGARLGSVPGSVWRFHVRIGSTRRGIRFPCGSRFVWEAVNYYFVGPAEKKKKKITRARSAVQQKASRSKR